MIAVETTVRLRRTGWKTRLSQTDPKKGLTKSDRQNTGHAIGRTSYTVFVQVCKSHLIQRIEELIWGPQIIESATLISQNIAHDAFCTTRKFDQASRHPD